MRKLSILKVLVVVCTIILTVLAIMPQVSQAYTWDVNQFDSQNNQNLDNKAKSIVGAIISVIRIVATGVAIIMLTMVAIKYMSSAPNDRAEIKKHAVVYVVGALVLFGSSGILKIIQNFAGTF